MEITTQKYRPSIDHQLGIFESNRTETGRMLRIAPGYRVSLREVAPGLAASSVYTTSKFLNVIEMEKTDAAMNSPETREIAVRGLHAILVKLAETSSIADSFNKLRSTINPVLAVNEHGTMLRDGTIFVMAYNEGVVGISMHNIDLNFLRMQAKYSELAREALNEI